MKLIKNMAYNTVYQLMIVLLPLVTIPYVSRVLGVHGIGINAYTSSFVTYFTILANLGIQMYGNREIAYSRRDIREKSRLFFELVLLKIFSVLISLIFFALFVTFQSQWQFYFLLQGVAIVAVAFDVSWYFMGVENFRIVVVRNAVIRLLTVLATFLLVRSASDLWIYIALLSGSTFLGNLSVWPFLRREIVRVSLGELRVLRHLRPAALLFFPQIMSIAYLSINKNMLGLMHGVASAGLFSQSDTIVRVVYTLISSFGVALLPHISGLLAEGQEKKVKTLTLKSLDVSNALAFLAIAGVAGASGTFAPFFFGKDFRAVGSLMLVESLVILFIAWGNILGVQYLLATRRMRAYVMSAVVGLIVNVLFNVVLIPGLAAMGAVVATVLTELAVSGYQIVSLRDVFGLREIFRGIWKYALAGGATFLTVYWLGGLMRVGLLAFLVQGVSGVAVYVILLLVLRAPVMALFWSFVRRGK